MGQREGPHIESLSVNDSRDRNYSVQISMFKSIAVQNSIRIIKTLLRDFMTKGNFEIVREHALL